MATLLHERRSKSTNAVLQRTAFVSQERCSLKLVRVGTQGARARRPDREEPQVTAREELTGQVAEGVSQVVSQLVGRRSGPPGRARRAASAERLSTDRIVDVAIAQMREHGY